MIDEGLDAYFYMVLLLIHAFSLVLWMVSVEETLYLSFGWVVGVAFGGIFGKAP